MTWVQGVLKIALLELTTIYLVLSQSLIAKHVIKVNTVWVLVFQLLMETAMLVIIAHLDQGVNNNLQLNQDITHQKVPIFLSLVKLVITIHLPLKQVVYLVLLVSTAQILELVIFFWTVLRVTIALRTPQT